MSDLDAVFEPRDVTHNPPEARVTKWARAPEYLRPLLDTWEELVGFHAMGSVAQLWMRASKTWYEHLGSDPDKLRHAFRVCRNRHPEVCIKSPGSVMFIALDEKAKGTDGSGRQRYADALKRYEEADDE